MNYNPDMRLQEDNHLAIARPFLQPGVACFMPRAFMCGSQLPDWKGTTVFFLATPKLGAKFLECTLEISKDGGSIGRIQNKYENYMFVLEGSVELTLYGKRHTMEKHGYFWAPPGSDFELVNKREETARVLWVRKIYVPPPYVSGQYIDITWFHLFLYDTGSFDPSHSVRNLTLRSWVDHTIHLGKG